MGKKVAFVDDSGVVLMSADMALESLIESGTVELFKYENPVEFLDEVESGKIVYDLLITDINMPQMNGLELIERLKAKAEFKARPILALTTENSTEMKEAGKAVGLNGWISKPFSDEKLIMAVKRILRLR